MCEGREPRTPAVWRISQTRLGTMFPVTQHLGLLVRIPLTFLFVCLGLLRQGFIQSRIASNMTVQPRIILNSWSYCLHPIGQASVLPRPVWLTASQLAKLCSALWRNVPRKEQNKAHTLAGGVSKPGWLEFSGCAKLTMEDPEANHLGLSSVSSTAVHWCLQHNLVTIR